MLLAAEPRSGTWLVLRAVVKHSPEWVMKRLLYCQALIIFLGQPSCRLSSFPPDKLFPLLRRQKVVTSDPPWMRQLLEQMGARWRKRVNEAFLGKFRHFREKEGMSFVVCVLINEQLFYIFDWHTIRNCTTRHWSKPTTRNHNMYFFYLWL